jgi:hypothetical protein
MGGVLKFVFIMIYWLMWLIAILDGASLGAGRIATEDMF